MPSVLCCASRRQLSPEIPNSRVVETPKADRHGSQGQTALSPPYNVLEYTHHDETDPEIRRIFALSSLADDDHGSSASLEHPSPRRASRSNHKKSSSRLSVALRKRFSRDSDFSDRSTRVKRNLSEEEVERRKELRRALHQRVRDEMLEDGVAGEGDYDTDAELIVTPVMTKVRSIGAIKISPQHLGSTVSRADSSRSLGISNRKLEAAYQPLPPTRTSSKTKDHINDSPSSKSEHWEDAYQDLPIEPATYENDDVFEPKSMVYVTNLEPELHPRHSETKLSNGTIEVPLSPDLLPLRLPSISESVQRGWHLSVSSSHQEALIAEPSAEAEDKGSKRGSVSRSLPPEWLHGASGLLLPFGSRSGRPNMRDEGTHLDKVQENEADSTVADLRLGNVDGAGSYSCKTRTMLGLESTPIGDVSFAVRRRRQSTKGDSMEEDYKKYQNQASSSSYDNPNTYRHWHPTPIDNGSSVYASQAASPSSNSLSSIARLPKILNEMVYVRSTSPANSQSHSIKNLSKFEKGPLEALEVDLMKRCPTDTSSFHSSTDSFRAKELAAAESRIIIPKPRAYSSPKISRFTEELDEEIYVIPRRASAYPVIGHDRRSTSRELDGSGSDEWYTEGKRKGYGYSFVAPKSDNLAHSWENALQNYAEEASPNIQKVKTDAAVDRTRLMLPSHTRRDVSTSSTVSEDPLSAYDFTIYGESTEGIAGADDNSVLHRRQQQRLFSQKSPPASWSRYPSHLRSARGAAAGAEDKVIVRDFSEEAGAKLEVGKDGKSLNPPLGKTKSRSMTFGKSMLKKIGTLYLSKSATFRSFEHGHRSSISAGGKLEFPELELLPPIFTSEPLKQIPSMKSEPSLTESVFSHGDSVAPTLQDPFAKIEIANERDAKAWSRVYADCVTEYPRETEDLGDVEDLRSSTLVFQAAMEDDAKKAREEALRAANQTWSTDGSPMGGSSSA